MKQIISTVFLCLSVSLFAQVDEKDVLFTVDEEPVLASEFIRVYNKNLDLVKDESQKDIDAYLKLFVNYQLKVKEAKRLELDKAPKYVREFSNYKSQLTKNFMSDNKVTEALVKEAYDRSTEDIKASHILIRLDVNEKDTTEVYNRLLKLREQIKKQGFEAVQKEVHDGKTIYAEDLGYFSAFKMVYPFENAAYNTTVGEVSMPFRTRFGFHIVKVLDRRPSLGEVTVSHIMISNKQNDTALNPETRINEIYKKLQQGENFESLAKQFSDDKSSSSKGGRLSSFTGGQLSSQEFEDVAFSLNEKNEISKPFKTDYGWHIIKFIQKKEMQPYVEVKALFENKVKRDSRSKLINSVLAKQLKAKYILTNNKEALSYFESLINDNFFKRSWALPQDLDKEQTFLKIENQTITYQEFAKHLFSSQRNYINKKLDAKALIQKEYDSFLETKLIQYQKDNLEFENQEFAHVLKEYRDGLLLFDLMENQIWNAASKDSLGLIQFYEANKDNYVWKDRVDVIIMSSASKKNAKKAYDALQKGASVEDIESKLNTDGAQNIISTKGVLETDHQALPKDFELKEGVSGVYVHNEAYHAIKVNKIIPERLKTLEESKGKVISDYQNQIENQWITTLNERYDVKINTEVLKKVKSQILN
ncbi:peptidylprolyl isomerase [uncultured Psychroserpens sp.]|uniref:peptidylprolyl isomerase n=1 Tax=uncultured Psychroserpens sp. TaxID=255436 RepID=UPI0026393BAD|nr:peptidylprolyl isomerase [uncultured Psychroserpens sp.]